MMIGGVCLGSLLIVSVFLGFAYIIWVMAAKEAGGIKTLGQVIAVFIAGLAALILIYCTIYGGVMGQGCFGRGLGMWGPGMMRHMKLLPQNEQRRYMRKMMKSPQIRKWMEEYMEENKK